MIISKHPEILGVMHVSDVTSGSQGQFRRPSSVEAKCPGDKVGRQGQIIDQRATDKSR
jgi:hypothetical protein